MDTLKWLENFLFSVEFDEDPNIEPFSITICDHEYHYVVEQHGSKWYVVTF